MLTLVGSLLVGAAPAAAQSSVEEAERTLRNPNGPIAPRGDGVLRSGPDAAAVGGQNRVDVVVQGTDGYYWTYWTGTHWTRWTGLGVPPPGLVEGSRPTIASWAPGRLDVFVRGADDDLWQRFTDNGGASWSPWIQPVGDDGVLASAPTVNALSGERLTVYVVGTDGQIWERIWTGSQWNSGWLPQGAPPTSIVDDPTSVSHNGTSVDIFVRGGDDDLWQRNWNGSAWSAWVRPVGDSGVLASGPDATSWSQGTLQVAVRGTDGGVWVLPRADDWGNWVRLGGSWDRIVGAPGVASRGFQAIDVFGRGTDDHLYQFWTDGGPSDGEPGGVPPLTQSCVHEERDVRIDIQYPQGWHVNSAQGVVPCSAFDPEPVNVEPGTEFPRSLAVVVRVEPVGFAQASNPTDLRVEDEQSTTIDGRQAVRQLVVSTGGPLVPAGVRSLRHVIDAGPDRSIIATTYDVEGNDFAQSSEVLDAMAAEFDITPRPGDGDGDDGTTPVGDPGFDSVQTPDFPAGGTPALLTDVRVGDHATFERVVLEFQGDDAPSYRVGYIQPPIREDGSGNQVDVEGDAFLELRLSPASGVDLRGDEPEQTYTGPQRIDPGQTEVVTELLRIGDFEGQLAWVVGLEERVPFGVTMLENPLRLVVDVVTG